MSRCVQTFDWYCIYYLYICIRNNKEHPSQLSVRAQHGAAVEKFLRKGRSVPDELLVDIAVEAIRFKHKQNPILFFRSNKSN